MIAESFFNKIETIFAGFGFSNVFCTTYNEISFGLLYRQSMQFEDVTVTELQPWMTPRSQSQNQDWTIEALSKITQMIVTHITSCG